MKNELRRMEDLFIDGGRNFHIAMDISPLMLWITEKNFTVYLNRSWLDFTGRSLSQELGKGRFENIFPEDMASAIKIINDAFKSRGTYEVEYRLGHNNGEYKWVLEQGRPIFNRSRVLKGFIGGCVDIDSQKKIELKLRESEERYRRLFETARDGILILNSHDGKITEVNPFLEQLLGYSKEEFLGKKIWEVGTFKNTKASKEMFKELQETGYVRYEDLPLETKDGRRIEVEFVSNAYLVGDERVMQCNIRDISDRKRIEKAEKSLILLEQEKLKTSFIADATHELRTPLAIIKGNIDLALRAKNNNGNTLKTLRAVNTEVNHLAGMLSDLTMLTTERGTDKFQKKVSAHKVDLKETLLEVIERCRKIAISRKITINTKTIPATLILGDKAYLIKLFSNIINNAIFYGKKNGNVTISGEKKKQYIFIKVIDDGIGISKKDLPFIFGRFYRSAEAKIVNHGGSGLGLSISKWIVEAHGGSITVTSTKKEGTIFTICLPL